MEIQHCRTSQMRELLYMHAMPGSQNFDRRQQGQRVRGKERIIGTHSWCASVEGIVETSPESKPKVVWPIKC